MPEWGGWESRPLDKLTTGQILVRVGVLFVFGTGVTLASAGVLGVAVRIFQFAAWGV